MKIIRTTSVSVAVFGLQQNHNHRPHKQMTEFAENPTTTKTTRIQMNRIKVTEIAQLVAFHSSQSKMSFAMESKFLFNGFCFPFSFVQFISVVGISFLFSKCFTLFCCLVDSCFVCASYLSVEWQFSITFQQLFGVCASVPNRALLMRAYLCKWK